MISPNFANRYICKHLFGEGALLSCEGVFSKKDGEIQVLVDLAPSSQTVTTVIIEDPLAGKAGYKKID